MKINTKQKKLQTVRTNMREQRHQMTRTHQIHLINRQLLEGKSALLNTYRYVLAMLFIACFVQKIEAQAIIRLENCGFSYIDPQNANLSNIPTRDSMVFTQFFTEDSLLKAFYVDINAFGGQQVDRTQVFAILPDSSKLLLGELAFGNCTDCVEGFALMYDGVLETQQVSTRQQMDMWLQGFAQPPFKLTGNLQTLRGVGRISGRIPFCAIGWQVEYSVFNTPNNSSTEFSTHILCPKAIASCPIAMSARLDCPNDSLYLRAVLPSECFSNATTVIWTNQRGFIASTPETALSLNGNMGMYYLAVEDAGCVKTDSIWVENPPFTSAGSDVEVCVGEAISLVGTGGMRHYWEMPSGQTVNDSLLLFANSQSDQSGAYILHAFDAIGCEDTDTLQVIVHTPPEPVVFFETPCLGDTLTLQVLNDSAFSQISWASPQGILLDPPQVLNFQTSDAGDYSLTGTDVFGCNIQKTILVNGNAPPELQIAIEENCDSTRAYLAPESYQFSWENGASGNVFASASGGTYTVTVTDPTGCASIATIELPEPRGPGVDVKVTQPFCPGDPGAIEIVADNPDRPLIFSIDGGATYSLETQFKNLPYGEYHLVIQDALGCEQSVPVQIIAPDSMGVSLNIDSLEVRPGAPVRLEATAVGNIQLYQWLPQEIDTGAPVAEFEAKDNLNVRLIVEDTRGCRATDGFFLRIVLGEIFAPNAFSPNDDGANDRFTLYSDNGSGEILEAFRIFDRWGNLLFEKKEIRLNDESQGWDGTVRNKPANPGVYTYAAVVRFGNGTRKTYAGDVTLTR